MFILEVGIPVRKNESPFWKTCLKMLAAPVRHSRDIQTEPNPIGSTIANEAMNLVRSGKSISSKKTDPNISTIVKGATDLPSKANINKSDSFTANSKK